MSWLRIDDGFGDHPKLLLLTRAERWTFVELLTYCAKHRTEGYFPTSIGETRKYITPAFVAKCERVGLVDRIEDDEVRIHDWSDFNPTKDPTGAVRQQRWRNAQRNGARNDERNGRVTENVTGDVTASRARDPVPYPNPSKTEGSNVVEKNVVTSVASYDDDELRELTEQIGKPW